MLGEVEHSYNLSPKYLKSHVELDQFFGWYLYIFAAMYHSFSRISCHRFRSVLLTHSYRPILFIL